MSVFLPDHIGVDSDKQTDHIGLVPERQINHIDLTSSFSLKHAGLLPGLCPENIELMSHMGSFRCFWASFGLDHSHFLKMSVYYYSFSPSTPVLFSGPVFQFYERNVWIKELSLSLSLSLSLYRLLLS